MTMRDRLKLASWAVLGHLLLSPIASDASGQDWSPTSLGTLIGHVQHVEQLCPHLVYDGKAIGIAIVANGWDRSVPPSEYFEARRLASEAIGQIISKQGAAAYCEYVNLRYGPLGTVDRGYVLPRPGASQPPSQATRAKLPPEPDVEKAQSLLLGLGYDPGPTDGYRGQRTRIAIESFQRDHQLPVTGVVTSQLIAALITRAAIDEPPWTPLDIALPPAKTLEKLTPSEVFKRAESTVWMVVVLSDNSNTQGSAVAVTHDRLVTNCHIFQRPGKLLIIKDEIKIEAKLIARHKATDRCLLQASLPLGSFVQGVRPFSKLGVGERTYSIGSPRGLERTLSEGIISGLRANGANQYVQTTTPISPGSSGGGLFDESGNLIGVTTFLLRDSQSLNFAIAADEYWR